MGFAEILLMSIFYLTLTGSATESVHWASPSLITLALLLKMLFLYMINKNFKNSIFKPYDMGIYEQLDELLDKQIFLKIKLYFKKSIEF